MSDPKRRKRDSKIKNKSNKKEKLASVWRDEDDEISDHVGVRDRKVKYQAKENAQYQSRLQESFLLAHGPTPEWAKSLNDASESLGIENDQDDVDKLERFTQLPPNELQFERCVPLNNDMRDEGPIIRSIKFNPVKNIALVAGDNVVNMIKVTGGKSNPLLQKISFPNMQIKETAWSHTGNDFYVTSRKERINWFSHYNIATGKTNVIKPVALTREDRINKLISDPSGRLLIGLATSGKIHLFSEATKEYIDTMYMSDNVCDAAFNFDGSKLYTYGGDGEIFYWDLNERECISAWYDQDHAPLKPQCLARCSDYMAFGCDSGIVNVYANSDFGQITKIGSRQVMPKPRKIFKNLTTPITSLAMNYQSEIMAVASSYKEGSFRLLHLPTMTTFQNFATKASEIGRINCVDFSPESGYLSFGNNRGTAFLYRLTHYGTY